MRVEFVLAPIGRVVLLTNQRRLIACNDVRNIDMRAVQCVQIEDSQERFVYFRAFSHTGANARPRAAILCSSNVAAAWITDWTASVSFRVSS